MKRLFFLLFLLAMSAVPAIQEAAAEPATSKEAELSPFFEELKKSEKDDPNRFFYEFMSMLSTLGLVVAVIFVLSWFVKRMTNTRIQQANASCIIKIIERRSLSPKTTLYLLDIHGKSVMIAESANGVTNVGSVPHTDEDEEVSS